MNKKGFILVGLLVVIVILELIGILTIPDTIPENSKFFGNYLFTFLEN